MSRLLKVLLAVTALSGLILFVVGMVLWTRPLLVMSALARWELERAGLEEVTVDGPRGALTYYRNGDVTAEADGPPVVLVHGLGHDAGTWGAVATGLARDHRLLVPDLPGHGESGPEDGPLSLRDEVEGLAAVIDRETRSGETVVLVGNSMGGWVSLLYAHEHPRRVERLVLVSSAGYYTDLEGVSLTPTTREEARAMVTAVMGEAAAEQTPGFILDDIVDQVPSGPAPRLFESFQEADLMDEKLADIAVPVDVVWGDRDGLMPLSFARRFEADLPRARLHVLEGCAHAPQRACPDVFIDLLAEVLASDPPPGSPPPPPRPATDPPPADAG